MSHRHTRVRCAFPDRCLVAPSPQLRTRIRERLRSLAADNELMPGARVAVRTQNRPGFNDGLIVPGTEFPLDAGPSVKDFLAHPVTHQPGTYFRYNTPGSYMLAAIVTKATGQTSLDYLKPRLFAPLGIENPAWGATAEGYNLGGYGLFVRTEDIAKFGQLYLQKGKWNGKQLLPEKWVAAATAKQVDNSKAPSARNTDWQQGYGFQFWRCQHNAYRGDGRDGQICLVLPEQDAVIAITAQTGQMQTELDLIWEKLLPAFRPEPLPANAAELEKLKQTLAGLTAHPVKKVN